MNVVEIAGLLCITVGLGWHLGFISAGIVLFLVAMLIKGLTKE